ncbi:MAG: hypothetical protein P8L31_10915 [Pseudomonadales bacterium]|nr:hypothetical protein [Pseudomonadales bacterium]
MSFEKRRTRTVYAVIQGLFADGKTSIRPGNVNSVLRAQGMPMGTWEVRAEFSRLEREDAMACDPETGDWHLTENSSLKETG